MLTATCSSDLIATLRGVPHSAVTQLKDIPSCKPYFFEVHLVQGMTFWVPTHAPQPLVICLGSVSAFLSYHAHGSPLGVALSWVVSVPGILQRWRGYFTSQATPYWYWDYGLEATFLFSSLLFWGTGARGLLAHTVTPYCAAPSTVFPTCGYRGVTSTMPQPGDAHTWQRPKWSTYWLPPLGPLGGSHHMFWLWLWLWLWSTPGDGSVQKQ